MAIKYRKGYDYQLSENAAFHTSICPPITIKSDFLSLDSEGGLTILAGYAWDGASGPTLNSDSSMTPSLVHDALYQLMREGRLHPEWRKEADEQLYRMLRQRGMSWVRAKSWLAGVRWFAGGAATPGDTKKVFEAA